MGETYISYSETAIWDSEAYDAPRRRLVPDFDRFYGTAVELVAGLDVDRPRVLDLGAGTGILSASVRVAIPDAELTLLDGAAPMLAVARRRLGDVATITADLTDPLPAGPFDAVVSALAIHHLTDDAKRDLFTRVLAVLRPGGVFVNAEQVAGASPWHQAQYEAAHERDARALGTDDAEWAAALERMTHDRCAPAEDQVAWLAAAGFERADMAFKRYGFAVYAGFAPENGTDTQP
jgi:tRNA (cmo5U34)-methyltransferase